MYRKGAQIIHVQLNNLIKNWNFFKMKYVKDSQLNNME